MFNTFEIIKPIGKRKKKIREHILIIGIIDF